MQINPSEISELIKSKIQNLQVAAEKRNEGTVISVTDGICRIHGLTDVMQGEMLSVTEITVPSLRFSAATWRFWIFDLISSLISEGLICMTVP